MTDEKFTEIKTIPVKNLSHLKRLLQKGAEFSSVAHAYHPEYIGLIRVVDSVQSKAVYSKIKGQPEHKFSMYNFGKGLRTDFEKADRYIFGNTVKVLDGGGNIIYEFEVLENE